MYYGRGSRRAGRLGSGFGFRGYAPAWPYVGQGRGGLPRCWAFASYAPSGVWSYPGERGFYQSGLLGGGGGGRVGGPLWGDEEVTFLKNQATLLRQELERIDARVKELEKDRAEP